VKQATPAQILAQLHAQRDGMRQVQVSLASDKLRIGKDALQLTITPQQDGYLYIALAGSDQKSLYLLYPNALEQNNAVKAGVALHLPAASWQITAMGPRGKDTLLVMITDAPRRVSQLKALPAGPFVQSLLDRDGRSLLQQVLSNSANQGSDSCSSTSLRNLQVARQCSDAFGSSLLTLSEVK